LVTCVAYGLLMPVAIPHKKLCYRKQIACQLRTQFVEGICSNSVTYKSRLGVTQDHQKWHHRLHMSSY